ncbi:hypothetical protein MMC14_007317 [Varicellaria rhodocarpa]|nr:hypothetical protein [Varicellaria rhodocarpa]
MPNCQISGGSLDYIWYQTVLTHTVATEFITISAYNGTYLTSTSTTINNSSFSIPDFLDGEPVDGTTIDIGAGVTLYVAKASPGRSLGMRLANIDSTWPTSLHAIFIGISSDVVSLFTYDDGSVSCTATTFVTESTNTLVPYEGDSYWTIPNSLYASWGIQPVSPSNCSWQFGGGVPSANIPVLSLTKTSTIFQGDASVSPQPQSLPSVVAPKTSIMSSTRIETTSMLSSMYSTFTVYSTPSPTTISTNGQSPDAATTVIASSSGHAVMTDSSNSHPVYTSQSSNGPIGTISEVSSASSNTILAAGPGLIITLEGSAYTPSGSEYIIGTQTLAPGSAIEISGIPVSLVFGSTALVVGTSMISLDRNAAAPAATITSAAILPGSTTKGSEGIGLVIESQTMLPGGPAITISGTQYSLASSATALIIGAQTLTQGGPVVTISGTPYSLAASATALIIGTSTILPSIYNAPPTITIDGSIVTANSLSQYIVGTNTLIPGGPAITVDGTPVSLALSATILVVGTSTVLLDSTLPQTPAVITIAGSVLTANSASDFIIGSQTIIPGGPVITLSGTPVSLAPSGSVIIIGSLTIPLGSAFKSPVITIAGLTATENSASDFVIGTQTLIPGGPPLMISGTPISLAPGATEVVIGSQTETLAAAAMSTEGLGGLIMSGFGGVGSGASTTTTMSSVGSGGTLFTGGTGGREREVTRFWRIAYFSGALMGVLGEIW